MTAISEDAEIIMSSWQRQKRDSPELPSEEPARTIEILRRSFHRMPDRAESVRRFAHLDPAIAAALAAYDAEIAQPTEQNQQPTEQNQE